MPHPPGLHCELLCTLSPQLLLGRVGLVLWKALASADLFHPFLDLRCLFSPETETTSTPGGLGEDLELVRVEGLEQCLALSRHSINGRCPGDHL